ncbi:DUF1450 domain-containing protein [Cohnella fermenti]|uniref:DUF1450 domain-containing protein n=1 Tax=Cohnella fermenti TaxID=2565925 RepID=A0A4S4BXH8_9BACL|nr:DUF1450 domain-containing protein [Cohnella fermenti]THF79919.1 DUF1450 domain-containing protein [Cohnella fermenti]
MGSTEQQLQPRPRAAKNDIRICDKCRNVRIKSLKSKLEAAAPGTEVKVECKSYCGPCKRTGFVFINGRYLKGETEDELVEKAKPFIK